MKTEEVSEKSTRQQTAVGRSPLWKRRAIVTTSVVLSILATGIGVAPIILTATSQRNRMLQSSIGNAELTATAESATGGWFAPLVFRDVRLTDADERFVWTVKEMQTSKGMLSFLTDPVHVEQVRIVGSSLTVKLDKDGRWPLHVKPRTSKNELSFQIENGSLALIVPWRSAPIVELDGLNITGNIGPDANGQRMLNIDPIQVFDHAPISESHTQQNLALIAPVLSQSTTLKGTASVWLDAIHLPLQGEPAEGSVISDQPQISIRGRAEFHSLEARLKETWTRQITALVGQVTGTALPDKIEVLENSTVEFAVNNEGIYHQGMCFLLPQIAQELTFTSSGLIRLDESLDLLLTLNVPKVIPVGRPFLVMLSQLTDAPMQLKVLGTVSKPELQLPEGMNLLGELTRRIAPAQYTEEAPPVTSAVIDLFQNVSSQDPEQKKNALPGSILNLIRAVDKTAKEKKAANKAEKKAGRK